MDQPQESKPPKRIVVIRRNGFGDLLLTYPMLKKCREFYPQAYLILIVDKRNFECSLWIDHPCWNEVRVLTEGNKYLSVFKMAWGLRGEKIDLAISAKPSCMTLMTLFLVFSKAIVKRAVVEAKSVKLRNALSPFRLIPFFKKIVNLREWLQTKINAPISPQKVNSWPHQAQRVLKMLPECLTIKKNKQTFFDINDFSYSETTAELDPSLFPILKPAPMGLNHAFYQFCLLHQFIKDQQSITFYVNVSNNRAASRLDPNQLLEVFGSLKFSYNIVLGGLSSDIELAKDWLKALSGLVKAPIGIYLGSSLEMTLAALQNVDLVVTGDGGLMHLAAACDTYQLALFAHTSVLKWSPLSLKAHCLFNEYAVKNIPVKEVLEQVLLLANKIWLSR